MNEGSDSIAWQRQLLRDALSVMEELGDNAVIRPDDGPLNAFLAVDDEQKPEQ